MSVYIVTHKKFDMPVQKGYKTILVGACKGHILGEDVLNDDVGDNISDKNANYCELTGQYWLWKHVSDEYIGLVHYRRYFCRHLNKKKILSEKDIVKKLKKYDIIVPFLRKLKVDVVSQYCRETGFRKDIEIARDIIAGIYPDYVEDFDSVFNGNRTYFYNMMIARRDVFSDYCSWLFPILSEMEKRCDISDYNDYQKRIFGFMAERLLTVYIRHNKLKCCEVGVVNPEVKGKFPKNILIALKRVIMFKFA